MGGHNVPCQGRRKQINWLFHVNSSDLLGGGLMLNYKIANIEKLLKQLDNEADFQRESLHNEQYAQEIEYAIEKVKEILDST